MTNKRIKAVAAKKLMTDETSDVTYWRSRSVKERIAALEEIRREYNNWKYSDAEQRFQRVYRRVKLQ